MAINDGACSEPETCNGDTVGLREKKRRATRRSIEDSATDLVLQLGYDNVTVEDICSGAGISRRTFFNYFDSKDAAIFGDRLTPRPDTLRAFRDGPAQDPLHAVLEMVGELISEPYSGDTDLEDPISRHRRLRNMRKEIIQSEPALARIWLLGFETGRLAINAAVLAHLEMHPDMRRCPDMTVEEEAILIANLSRLIAGNAALYSISPDDPMDEALDKLTRFITATPNTDNIRKESR